MPDIDAKYRRDYKDAEYSNPRLTRDREKRSHRWRVVFLCVSIIVIIGFVYFLFFSPVFVIKEVQVVGLEKIKPESINNLLNEYRGEQRLLFLSNNNIWLFDATEVKARIKQKYLFEKLEIKKQWPATIKIELKEKISAINWLSNNLCYHLDLTGMAIEYCDGAGKNITIKDMMNSAVTIGESAISRDELIYIVELAEQYAMIMKIQIMELQIEKTENLLDFIAETGPVVRFNSNLTQAEQIARLGTILEQPDFAARMNNLEYIDLRFGEKIYYK